MLPLCFPIPVLRLVASTTPKTSACVLITPFFGRSHQGECSRVGIGENFLYGTDLWRFEENRTSDVAQRHLLASDAELEPAFGRLSTSVMEHAL